MADERDLVGRDDRIPADNLQRGLVMARPNADPNLPHLGVAGDTYTILLAGKDTAGQFCLIDMHIPPGGGPPAHRHDFEETFSLLEGELEFSFRGEKHLVRAGETINVPANAPHQFLNRSQQVARMLCICSPAGQENFFVEIGVPVAGRTAAPPRLEEKAEAELRAKAVSLAKKYRTEFLKHT